jgi:hypothetical protein
LSPSAAALGYLESNNGTSQGSFGAGKVFLFFGPVHEFLSPTAGSLSSLYINLFGSLGSIS